MRVPIYQMLGGRVPRQGCVSIATPTGQAQWHRDWQSAQARMDSRFTFSRCTSAAQSPTPAGAVVAPAGVLDGFTRMPAAPGRTAGRASARAMPPMTANVPHPFTGLHFTEPRPSTFSTNISHEVLERDRLRGARSPSTSVGHISLQDGILLALRSRNTSRLSRGFHPGSTPGLSAVAACDGSVPIFHPVNESTSRKASDRCSTQASRSIHPDLAYSPRHPLRPENLRRGAGPWRCEGNPTWRKARSSANGRRRISRCPGKRSSVRIELSRVEVGLVVTISSSGASPRQWSR